MSTLIPTPFTDIEDTFFDELVDEAELDAIVDALFPPELTKPGVGSPPSRPRS